MTQILDKIIINSNNKIRIINHRINSNSNNISSINICHLALQAARQVMSIAMLTQTSQIETKMIIIKILMCILNKVI